jgi:hypothetical protein
MKMLLLTLFAALAVGGPAGAAPPAVDVFFTRGEQLAPVQRDRTGAPLTSALNALLAGPTPAEVRAGVRTNVPTGTRLRGVAVRDRIAYVDLTRQFESGGGTASMTARLSQLVYTVTQFPTAQAVRLKLDGKLVVALGGEGLMVDHPLRRGDFAAPAFRREVPPETRGAKESGLVRTIQSRLRTLGYLSEPPDGLDGPMTRNAILAFEGWRGLPRTGRPTTALAELLTQARRPVASPGPAHRIDVRLERQVALLVEGGFVTRTIHVSTGAAGTPTPRGTFHVFRKELRSWSVPFQQWLPYASYFTGGIAFHEYADVPPYAASHGCVRVPPHEASSVYAFARPGTVVRVF